MQKSIEHTWMIDNDYKVIINAPTKSWSCKTKQIQRDKHSKLALRLRTGFDISLSDNDLFMLRNNVLAPYSYGRGLDSRTLV